MHEELTSKKLFSVIMLINEETEENTAKQLTALTADAEYFSKNVQLLLMDSVCSEISSAACGELTRKYPENISYFALEGKNLAECYNAAMEKATGEYIHFSKTSIELTCAHLQSAEKYFSKNKKISAACFFPTYTDIKGILVNYVPQRFATYQTSVQDENIFNLYLFSYFFRKKALENCAFDEKLIIDSELKYLLKVLMKLEKYAFIEKYLHCDEMLETDFYNYSSIYYREWYIESLSEVMLPLLEEYADSKFIQNVMAYLIELRFAANRNDRSKNILLKDDLPGFFELVRKVLQQIPDDILVQYQFGGTNVLPKHMGIALLRIKHDDYTILPEIYTSAKEFAAACGKTLIDKSAAMKVNVMAIDYENDALIIDGELTNAYVFDFDQIEIFVRATTESQNKVIDVKRTSIYSLDKYFGISMNRGYTFQVRVPLPAESKSQYKISFNFRYSDCAFVLPMSFVKSQARLTNQFQYDYWRFKKHIMFYNKKEKALFVNPEAKSFIFKREILLMLHSLAQPGLEEKLRAVKSILLRLAYWITKPFYAKKQHWMTFDQLFKGGDNGEYFFKYVSSLKRKDIKIYYVINKGTKDYKRLKKTYRNTIAFNSFHHKLVTLHTDIVFATRVDVKLYCGYAPQLEKYFRSLLDYKIFCLQHGLTIQRIAQYQNRLFDNTRLYFCVSPFETENLRHPVYGYDESVLKMTGAPRYDGLVNNDQRQILISPTWRRNVTSGTNKKGYRHEYSQNFKHTEYFRLYNSLINDERLIECAKKTNYRLIYLLHPILSPQLEDFDRNDYVEIMAGASNDLDYEKILTESTLMVTDYSGIQFDFAYMRKPLVYYHPDTLPPQYDEGGLDYSVNSLGPVCKNHEEIVSTLCEYMERDCTMDPVYKERADHFFTFDDHNNCKRIFEATMEYLEEKK